MKAVPLFLLGGGALVAAVGGGLAAFAGLTARRVEAVLPPQGRFVEIHGARIHYLGGALSLAVALEHPGTVSGLALISPLTQPQDAPPEAFAGLYIPSPLVRRLVAWTLACTAKP